MAFLMETESKITETVCFLAEISKNFDKNAEQKPLFLIFRKAKVRSGPFPLAGSRYLPGKHWISAVNVPCLRERAGGNGIWKTFGENGERQLLFQVDGSPKRF